ncbi:MAG TPA: hypothetical protein VN802_07170 [Stellaceae bacterium]|nr:hypothetical protein [Stellaceae bacterium]
MTISNPAVDDRQRRQRVKNLALLAVLAGLAMLFYVITLVRMGAGP